jgi:hypothetical protein
MQLSGDGNPIIQCVEVCADCKEMWLELDDGATAERPEIPAPPIARHEEPEYFAPAHVAQWHNRNGARPV